MVFTYDIIFKLQYCCIIFQDFCVFGVIYPHFFDGSGSQIKSNKVPVYAFPNALSLLDHSGMDIVIFSNIVTFQVVIYHR